MALIIALLVVAMATLVASSLAFDFSLDQRRTQSLLATQQSRLLALGAEAWAAQILADDRKNSSTDHLGEEWAIRLPPMPADEFLVEGMLEDMQGRFNINNLVDGEGKVDPLYLAQLQRLLVSLEIDPRLAGVLADWLDPDNQAGFPDGAEDDFYTGLELPYRTPNMSVSNITELQAVQGVTLEQFQKLLPYLTALPPGTPLNVNTAPPAVLSALSDELDILQAESLAAEAGERGFEDLQAFESLVDEDTFATLGLSTDFFRLTVRVTIGTYSFTMYSLLVRQANGQTRSLTRSFGTL